MADIYWGIALISALSLVAFAGAFRLARVLPARGCELVAALMLAVMILYVRHLWDDVLLARLLPFSNLIVVGNWFPVALAFLAGLAWHRVAPHPWRRAASVMLLVTVASLSIWMPLHGSPPECDDLWDNGVCLQTADATCSAACAATILRDRGINASEGEMAELCLTRNGTTWQGLYRGLVRKTEGTPWKVDVFRCDVDTLRSMPEDPRILVVELEDERGVDPRYARQWGWIPGQSHAVVLFRFLPDGNVDVGDPSVGREEWSALDMRVLWHGVGLRLVPR